MTGSSTALAAPAAGLRASEADRAALAEVLARPEFHPNGDGAAALRRLLLDLWDSLLERLGTAEAERYASLGRLVFFVAALVAAVLAWRAARRRRRAAAGPGAAPAVPVVAEPSGPAPRAATATELLRLGDLPGAVRAAFGAAAAGLTARGLAPEGAALTGRELAARARDERFDRLVRLHEETIFGRRPVSRDEALGAIETAWLLEPGAGPGGGSAP